MAGKNETEDWIQALLSRAFLRLWSVPNPLRDANNHEMCDFVSVFGDDVLVVSVGYRQLSPVDTSQVDIERWNRKVVEKSVRQLTTAKRRLMRMDAVREEDGTRKLRLPEPESARYHLVSVVLGARDVIQTPALVHRDGLIHMLNENAAPAVFGTLDTAVDLLQFLNSVEQAFSREQLDVATPYEDILALFLTNDRRFPSEVERFHLLPGLWESFSNGEAFAYKRVADQASAAWDNLIEQVGEYWAQPNVPANSQYSNTEEILRAMASQSRINRRILGAAFVDFIRRVKAGQVVFGYVPGPETSFVFHWMPHGTPGEKRQAALAGWCLRVRRDLRDTRAVVGIGVDLCFESWRMTGYAHCGIFCGPNDAEVSELYDAIADLPPLSRSPAIRLHTNEFLPFVVTQSVAPHFA